MYSNNGAARNGESSGGEPFVAGTCSLSGVADVIRLFVLLAAALLMSVPSSAATTTATPASIAEVLVHAADGDTIRLAPGSYPAIDLRDRHWSPPVTVDATAAQVRAVHLAGVSGLTWRGGTFDGGDAERQGVSIQKADHLVIDGATMRHYSRVGIGIGSSSDLRIVNNVFSDMGSDGVDVALSRRIVLDHNRCVDTHPTDGAHPDCIQLWSRPSEPPTADIVITNNDATGATAGFTAFNHVRNGVDDGGFDRITIENNHAKVSAFHGVTVYGCRDCIIRHNRVETLPDPANPRVRAWIKAVNSSGAVLCDNKAEGGSADGGGRCRD